MKQKIKNEIEAVVEALKSQAAQVGKPITPENEAYIRIGIAYGYPIMMKVIASLEIDKLAIGDFTEQVKESMTQSTETSKE